jgi:DNA adenine methylase
MSREPSLSRFPSPLRYPGGKGKVANFLKLLFLRNDLVGSQYAEPYAGGAGVALSLLYEEYASHIHLNDLDTAVYAFWNAVLNRTDALCRIISETEPNVDEWRRQRSVLEAENPDPLDLAFATFFLNRTNRSGIIRGGIIGGLDQSGSWKLDARYNRPNLINRIEKVARFRSRITLTPYDAAFYLQRVLPLLPSSALVYLDPPYFIKGQGLYHNAYEVADHVSIATLVPSIRQNWIVSYDAAPEIVNLYAAYAPIRYDLSYSAQERYKGREVLYLKPGLEAPNVPSPANISAITVDQTRRDRSLFGVTVRS